MIGSTTHWDALTWRIFGAFLLARPVFVAIAYFPRLTEELTRRFSGKYE
jgi:hypothetical protein